MTPLMTWLGATLPGHHATVISADIPHADVIAHDENNVGLRMGEGQARGDCHQEYDQCRCK
jgi:hypothetical protein